MAHSASRYVEWDPPAPWRDVVACCWEHRAGAGLVQRVLPDGHADLILHESGRVDVVGVANSVALPALPAGAVLRGVRLLPGAVSAAFRTRASALRNETIDADAVLGSQSARALRSPAGLDRWVRSVSPDTRVSAVTRLLGSMSVDRTAKQVGISGRQLRRVMLDEVGVGPKDYQRVVRFQRFVRLTDDGVAIAVAAAEAGYSDQAHANREVVRLSGLTPARLVSERRQVAG